MKEIHAAAMPALAQGQSVVMADYISLIEHLRYSQLRQTYPKNLFQDRVGKKLHKLGNIPVTTTLVAFHPRPQIVILGGFQTHVALLKHYKNHTKLAVPESKELASEGVFEVAVIFLSCDCSR